jgi:uncharacterized protein (DUF885 family)
MPRFPALATALALAATTTALPARFADTVSEFRADDRSIRESFDLPWTESSFSRRAALIATWEKRLAETPWEPLSQEERIDWLLLGNHLKGETDSLQLARRRLKEMAPLLPFREGIEQLTQARLSRTGSDPATAAATLAAIPGPLRSWKEETEASRKAATAGKAPPPVTPSSALRAAAATDAIRESLEAWFRFHDGYQPDFSWWTRQPFSKAREALEQHAKYLREELASQKAQPDDPLVGDPIGPEALAADIARELIPYSAPELIGIAEREFAWCEEEMRRAATAMGTNPKDALERVKRAHVPPGGQADLAAAEAARSIAFLRKHDLVSIPPLCEEIWRLEMIPPDAQKTLPYAVYGQPAMRVAYPTDAMAHEDKLAAMRGNNRHFLRIVTPHELIPGHHLQRFSADRSRTWRSLFSTPFFVEGWALHWEMLYWDRNYAESPEDRIGMLFWRMHRCARIIVSLRFHLGMMTPAEMIDFLVQRVGHETAGATSEVRRYIGGAYGPLYQAAYMLGGLQLRALHRELTGGGQMSQRAFHDAVLAENAIPFALVRAALTSEPLTKSWLPTWKFAE